MPAASPCQGCSHRVKAARAQRQGPPAAAQTDGRTDRQTVLAHQGSGFSHSPAQPLPLSTGPRTFQSCLGVEEGPGAFESAARQPAATPFVVWLSIGNEKKCRNPRPPPKKKKRKKRKRREEKRRDPKVTV